MLQYVRYEQLLSSLTPVLPMTVARSSYGGFMGDVISAHKPRLPDVAAKLKRSAHAALGLAISCA